MRKRRNTSWIDACASASAVEGQPDALSRDWSSQSDPKRALTNSFQVKADHVLFSRLMIATETAPVSLNTVDIRNIRSDCLLMSSGSGITHPLRSRLPERDKCLQEYLSQRRFSVTCAVAREAQPRPRQSMALARRRATQHQSSSRASRGCRVCAESRKSDRVVPASSSVSLSPIPPRWLLFRQLGPQYSS